MFVIYPVIFCKEGNEDYSVHIPDLGGATCGTGLEESYKMAVDYIGINLFDDFLEKKELPKSSKLEDINVEKYFEKLCDNDKEEVEKATKNSFVTLVGFDFIKYIKEAKTRTIRKNVSIPSHLNELGKKHNLSFSKLLKEALERELGLE